MSTKHSRDQDNRCSRASRHHAQLNFFSSCSDVFAQLRYHDR
jgi:hypothetical protein